jgi:hypothetical protein
MHYQTGDGLFGPFIVHDKADGTDLGEQEDADVVAVEKSSTTSMSKP